MRPAENFRRNARIANFTRKPPAGKSGGGRFPFSLFAGETVAASASLFIAGTRVAYVNFGQRAIIARMVVLTFGYSAADTSVYVFFFHVCHTSLTRTV